MSNKTSKTAEDALRLLLRHSPGAPPPALDLARIRAENEANRVLPPPAPAAPEGDAAEPMTPRRSRREK